MTGAPASRSGSRATASSRQGVSTEGFDPSRGGWHEPPDINDKAAIAEAIAQLEVLGGYSRSWSADASGEWHCDRYVEKLHEYVSKSDIEAAVDLLFPEPEE